MLKKFFLSLNFSCVITDGEKHEQNENYYPGKTIFPSNHKHRIENKNVAQDWIKCGEEDPDYLIGWRIISEAVCICWHSSTIHSKLVLTHQSSFKKTNTKFKMRALGHIEHTAERDAAVYITQSKVEVIWHLPYISLWQILHRRNNWLLQTLFRQTCCDSSRAIHNVRVMQRKRGMILFICLPDKRNLHQGD